MVGDGRLDIEFFSTDVNINYKMKEPEDYITTGLNFIKTDWKGTQGIVNFQLQIEDVVMNDHLYDPYDQQTNEFSFFRVSDSWF